jgi:hypothetical protein
MNKDEIRRILAVYRPAGEDAADPLIASAREAAEEDPELAQWFEEEQEFDRTFGEALRSRPLPAGLETRIIGVARGRITQRNIWARRIGLAAAALVVLVAFFSSWQGPLQPTASMADFRGEMVSFIKLPPPLELETSSLERIQNWLSHNQAAADLSIPPGLSALEPVGCRVLSFRGEKVTLICFRRSGKRLAHLLVMDRKALPKLRSNSAPVFAQEGEWATAVWAKGDRVYLLAAQGEHALIAHYLDGS